MSYDRRLADAEREAAVCHREIDELRAEIERLQALLRPFVDMVAEPEDFTAARRALAPPW